MDVQPEPMLLPRVNQLLLIWRRFAGKDASAAPVPGSRPINTQICSPSRSILDTLCKGIAIS